MQIGNVNGYVGIQNYRVPNIIKVEEVNQNAETMLPKKEMTQSADIVTQAPAERKASVTDLEDISLGFNQQDDYSYIGKDADIKTLDMEKAISDMRKDNLFQQYQFFVRSAMYM